MSRGARETILLVDDDEGIRDALSELLEDEGFEVQMASTGDEALRLLQTGEVQPAVIVLDVMMPGMDGVTFRRTQVATPALARIPVIVATAMRLGPNELNAFEGCAQFRKPFDLDPLLAEIRRCTSKLA
jgi:two-component system response regulator MprA